jgi:hypothetical protein
MKITEILVESQQLDEGPFGQAVGKFAGGVAKGVGAVAGGVAGLGKAFGKGYQSGKATVAGDPDPNAAPASGDAPEAPTKAAGGPETQPSATDINKAGPANTPQAKPLQGQAKVAADKTAAATADQEPSAAGQTMYAQVKANIDKLDKKGKQRILQLLQKSIAAPAPSAGAGGTTTKDQAGAGAMGAMASQLGAAGGKPANTMANAPVSATNTAKPGNPNAAPAATQTAPEPAPPAAGQPDALGRIEPTLAPATDTTAAPAPVKTRTGGRVKGQLSQDPRAVKRREANAAKTKQQAQTPDQATIDAERDKIMGVTSDSIVRRQPMMAEGFSLFRKRT